MLKTNEMQESQFNVNFDIILNIFCILLYYVTCIIRINMVFGERRWSKKDYWYAFTDITFAIILNNYIRKLINK